MLAWWCEPQYLVVIVGKDPLEGGWRLVPELRADWFSAGSKEG